VLCHPDSYRESYEIIKKNTASVETSAVNGSAKISPHRLHSKKFLIVAGTSLKEISPIMLLRLHLRILI
jgi:hypothetical protein